MKLTNALAIAGLLATTGACSDEPATNEALSGADASTDETPAASGGSCPKGCAGTPSSGSICAISADAQLVDTAGSPVPDEVLLLCAKNICSLPTRTDANGRVHFDLCLHMQSPALKFIGNSKYGSFAVAMTTPTHAFPAIALVPLPAAGAQLPASTGIVKSGPVTLSLQGPAELDPTELDDANDIEFRAASVATTQAPPGLDASFGVKALWALAPANATLNPRGTLTVPNPDPLHWPAGEVVDFVMNGLDASPAAPVPYGDWARIGSGTVSADGATISMNSGAADGLPRIGMVGVGPHAE